MADQNFWQQLNDPGINPKLDKMIALLDQLVQGQGHTPVATTSSSSNLGLIGHLPAGTVFSLPITLQRFNELIGASGLSGALPYEVEEEVTVAPYSTGKAQYVVPDGQVALSMADWYGYFSRHSPGMTLQGWLNYGLPQQFLMTKPGDQVTKDFALNLFLVGSHEVTNNITFFLTNNTPVAVHFLLGTIVILVDEARWRDTYKPIFRQALVAWINDFAMEARKVGAQSQ